MNASLTISIVIPVLNDHESLARILHTLREASEMPDEIIVVEGGQDQTCSNLAAKYHCIYLQTRPGRGYQLHAGADAAKSDVIWFLHADSQPPSAAVTLIRQEIAGGAIGGYFRFRFAGQPTWYKRLLASLVNLRTRIGVPYGDQGIFVRKSDYAATGGFPDSPLFEEVTVIKTARRMGRFVEIPIPIGVSPRRWERDGWFRRTIENRLLAAGYMLGMSPQTLARRYRPKC